MAARLGAIMRLLEEDEAAEEEEQGIRSAHGHGPGHSRAPLSIERTKEIVGQRLGSDMRKSLGSALSAWSAACAGTQDMKQLLSRPQALLSVGLANKKASTARNYLAAVLIALGQPEVASQLPAAQTRRLVAELEAAKNAASREDTLRRAAAASQAAADAAEAHTDTGSGGAFIPALQRQRQQQQLRAEALASLRRLLADRLGQQRAAAVVNALDAWARAGGAERSGSVGDAVLALFEQLTPSGRLHQLKHLKRVLQQSSVAGVLPRGELAELQARIGEELELARAAGDALLLMQGDQAQQPVPAHPGAALAEQLPQPPGRVPLPVVSLPQLQLFQQVAGSLGAASSTGLSIGGLSTGLPVPPLQIQLASAMGKRAWEPPTLVVQRQQQQPQPQQQPKQQPQQPSSSELAAEGASKRLRANAGHENAPGPDALAAASSDQALLQAAPEQGQDGAPAVERAKPAAAQIAAGLAQLREQQAVSVELLGALQQRASRLQASIGSRAAQAPVASLLLSELLALEQVVSRLLSSGPSSQPILQAALAQPSGAGEHSSSLLQQWGACCLGAEQHMQAAASSEAAAAAGELSGVCDLLLGLLSTAAAVQAALEAAPPPPPASAAAAAADGGGSACDGNGSAPDAQLSTSSLAASLVHCTVLLVLTWPADKQWSSEHRFCLSCWCSRLQQAATQLVAESDAGLLAMAGKLLELDASAGLQLQGLHLLLSTL